MANEVVSASELNTEQEIFPLELVMCTDCKHVQLGHLVDPRRLFSNYVYVSGTSSEFVMHFQGLAEQLTELTGVWGETKSVLEIGSNDGTLLGILKKKGYEVLGVDPAESIAADANAAGIPTLVDFFGSTLAQALLEEHGPFDVVIANNVFAHSGDLGDILQGVEAVMSDRGLFIFEVSYLKDVVEKVLFDTIYHEHTSYHHLAPLVEVLPRYGLEVFRAELIKSHGGSLRVFAQKCSGAFQIEPGVDLLLQAERECELHDPSTYDEFEQRIAELGRGLGEVLANATNAGKRVAGFGAPAKATTLCYQLGIKPGQVEFVVDDNPRKQGMYTPGLHIPIVTREKLEVTRPDYVVIFAWNFVDAIVKSNSNFLESGGAFIVPAPNLRLVSK